MTPDERIEYHAAILIGRLSHLISTDPYCRQLLQDSPHHVLRQASLALLASAAVQADPPPAPPTVYGPLIDELVARLQAVYAQLLSLPPTRPGEAMFCAPMKLPAALRQQVETAIVAMGVPVVPVEPTTAPVNQLLSRLPPGGPTQ